MKFTVEFTPEAQEQIAAIYRFIAQAASPHIAERYTSALVDYCEGLKDFPRRATLLNAIRPGLRLTNYKGRVVIAFAVEVGVVSIIGLYYGGQDYEAALKYEVKDPRVPYGLRPFQPRGGTVTNEQINLLRDGGAY